MWIARTGAIGNIFLCDPRSPLWLCLEKQSITYLKWHQVQELN